MQLLSDLIELQRRRKQPLWLLSFDVEKCFPTLPWWATFGVLGRAGASYRVVNCFRSFYEHLRQRFRYGQVDGSEWATANGLAQRAQRAKHLKAVGNDVADHLAKEASAGAALTHVPNLCFADVVLVHNTSGALIPDVISAVSKYWWERQRQEGLQRRAWLEQLYPADMELDWKVSSLPFRPPTVESGTIIYAAPASTLKWVARARSGGLATPARLVGSGMLTSPQCLCCPAPVQDDVHAVSGCPGTGAAD